MQLASLGMLIAIVGTLFGHRIVSYTDRRWTSDWNVTSLPISLWVHLKNSATVAISHAGGALPLSYWYC